MTDPRTRGTASFPGFFILEKICHEAQGVYEEIKPLPGFVFLDFFVIFAPFVVRGFGSGISGSENEVHP